MKEFSILTNKCSSPKSAPSLPIWLTCRTSPSGAEITKAGWSFLLSFLWRTPLRSKIEDIVCVIFFIYLYFCVYPFLFSFFIPMMMLLYRYRYFIFIYVYFQKMFNLSVLPLNHSYTIVKRRYFYFSVSISTNLILGFLRKIFFTNFILI